MTRPKMVMTGLIWRHKQDSFDFSVSTLLRILILDSSDSICYITVRSILGIIVFYLDVANVLKQIVYT